MHTTQGLAKTVSREADESLVTRKIVNEFWSMAQDEALAVLRSNCVSLCASTEDNMQLPWWSLRGSFLVAYKCVLNGT